MGRGDLADEEWDLIEPVLASARGRHASPALNGMLNVLRIGRPFRENLLMPGILPIIPPRSKRRAPDHPDYRRCTPMAQGPCQYELASFDIQHPIA